MMGWQWHQLDHMQIICTLLQTDNHTSTSPLRFQAGCPSCSPANSIKALKSHMAVVDYSLQAGLRKLLIFIVNIASSFTEFLQRAQLHCKRCISYGNSVRPSVRLFVRLSVTRRYCVKTTARSTMQFSLLDSKMCLVL